MVRAPAISPERPAIGLKQWSIDNADVRGAAEATIVEPVLVLPVAREDDTKLTFVFSACIIVAKSDAVRL